MWLHNPGGKAKQARQDKKKNENFKLLLCDDNTITYNLNEVFTIPTNYEKLLQSWRYVDTKFNYIQIEIFTLEMSFI